MARLIFISYRRADSQDIAVAIHGELERQLDVGSDVMFRDVEDIPPGARFADSLLTALEECRVILAIVGTQWAGKIDDPCDFVRREIEHGLARGTPVIPVLVHGVDAPRPDALPLSLRQFTERQAVRVSSAENFKTDVARLVRCVRPYVAAPVGASPRSGSGYPTVEQLLLDLFDTDSLRRWLRDGPDGPQLVLDLPSPEVPPRRLAEAAVKILAKSGQLQASFFERLEAARPGRRTDIERTKQQWLSGTRAFEEG